MREKRGGTREKRGGTSEEGRGSRIITTITTTTITTYNLQPRTYNAQLSTTSSLPYSKCLSM